MLDINLIYYIRRKFRRFTIHSTPPPTFLLLSQVLATHRSHQLADRTEFIGEIIAF